MRRDGEQWSGPVLRLRTAAIAAGVVALLAAMPTGASALPDGRVYERVSAQNTDGVPAIQDLIGNAIEVIGDDDDVLYGAGLNPAGDSPTGGQVIELAHRTPSGWTTSQFSPDPISDDGQEGLADATPGLTAAVFFTFGTTDLGNGLTQVPTTQLVYRDAAGNFSTIVTDANEALNEPSSNDPSLYGGMSADGQTVVYSSDVSPTGSEGLREVYVWHPDGDVSEIPNGTGEAADCGNELAGLTDDTLGGVGVDAKTTNQVSSDGTTVFVRSGQPVSSCPASQLYVSHGGVTTLISTPQPGVPALEPSTEAAANFVGASPDGQTAYFTTTNQLTTDATNGDDELYEWQAPTPGGPASLTCLSCTTGTFGAAFVAPGGGYVWFKSQATSGSDFEAYVAHDGTVTAVADVGPTNGAGLITTDAAGDVAVVQTTIAPTASTAGFDALDRIAMTAAGPQVTCLSCAADGTPEPANLSNHAYVNQVGLSYPSSAATLTGLGQYLSADGSEVVFDSTGGLTPDATPGLDEVYRWSTQGGLALVAPAADDPEISPDGSNIIFQSSAALTADTTQVGTDTLYDARVGGGFPAQPQPPAPCVGDECRGVGASAAPPPVGSTAPTSGNVHPSPPPRARIRSVRRPSAAQWRRFLAGEPLVLTVSVAGSGEVLATLAARLDGHRRILATGRADAHGRSSRVTLRLRLSASTRRQLAHARESRIPATLAVSSRDARTQTLRVTLTSRSGS